MDPSIFPAFVYMEEKLEEGKKSMQHILNQNKISKNTHLQTSLQNKFLVLLKQKLIHIEKLTASKPSF